MRKKGLLLLTSALLGTGILSSCSFFAGENIQGISSYETSVDNVTGTTYLTFYFTDPNADPLVISIPKGFAGKDGVSISNATVTDNEEDNSYTITMDNVGRYKELADSGQGYC